MTRRVALTGGIATGKSFVRAVFERLGVPTIDSDILARDAVAPGTPGLAAVAARFGPAVLDPSGALDRKRLAAVVFSDEPSRRDLEAIVHPIVRRETEAWVASLDPTRHPYAVADIPLLFETGRDRDFDVVVVAACDGETQLRRLMARDSLTEADARRRIDAQIPIDEKARRADYVIRTDASFSATETQVRQLHARLVSK